MKCPHCQKVHPDSFLFCPFQGKPIISNNAIGELGYTYLFKETDVLIGSSHFEDIIGFDKHNVRKTEKGKAYLYSDGVRLFTLDDQETISSVYVAPEAFHYLSAKWRTIMRLDNSIKYIDVSNALIDAGFKEEFVEHVGYFYSAQNTEAGICVFLDINLFDDDISYLMITTNCPACGSNNYSLYKPHAPFGYPKLHCVDCEEEWGIESV